MNDVAGTPTGYKSIDTLASNPTYSGGNWYPPSDDAWDLGTALLEWKDLYIDGVAYIDEVQMADNEKIRQGTGLDTDIYFDGTNQVISSAGALVIKVSGDTDDYFTLSVASNICVLTATGSTLLIPSSTVIGASASAPAGDTLFHIWKASAGTVAANLDPFTIENNTVCAFTLLCPNDQYDIINFGMPSGSGRGYIVYYGSSYATTAFRDHFKFAGAGAGVEYLDLSSAGVSTEAVYMVDGVQVVSNRVIDARCDDAINSGDATTDGVIDALRDAMVTHGLIAAA